MPVGRLHHLIVDCPDPMAEARFWGAVLGDAITYAEDDFVVVAADVTTSGVVRAESDGAVRAGAGRR